MNIKVILIVALLGLVVMASKIKECQAKCDKQVNGCIYTCAQTQLRQSLESQAYCSKLCDGVRKDCKNSKCYLES